MTVHIIHHPEIVTVEMLNAADALKYQGRTHFTDIYLAMRSVMPARGIDRVIVKSESGFPPDFAMVWNNDKQMLEFRGKDWVCAVAKENIVGVRDAIDEIWRMVK